MCHIHMVIPPSLCSSRYSLSCCFPFLYFLPCFLTSLTPSQLSSLDSPHMFKAVLTVFLCCFLSSSSVTISSHLFRSVLTTPIFWCNGWWESNARYWLVCVFFQYTFTFTDPSFFSEQSAQEWDGVVSLYLICKLNAACGAYIIEVCRPFIHFSSLYHLQCVVNIAFPQSRPKFFWCWLHRPLY